MDTGTLYYGDCLDWMQKWNDNAVDLIYLDPPFNSNAGYNILFGEDQGGGAQYRAFDDTWYWDADAVKRYDEFAGAVARRAHNAIAGLYKAIGPSGMMAYLTYMAERLEQMERILKPTGSIYLHCDPTASHYLKIVMDGIFGGEAFQNEITWKRNSSHNDSRKYGNITDTILFYGNARINRDDIRVPLAPEYVKKFYRYKDKKGRYTAGDLTAKGLTGGGYFYDFHGHPGPWRFPKTRILELQAAGLVHFPEKADGIPRLKRYLHENKGQIPPNIWLDIAPVQGAAKQRLGYPTQKPLALLERILLASSNPGDVVLDPFCGCGTTVEAAQRLNRQWAGIDISPVAIDIVKEKRLRDSSIPTKGIPADFASARKLAQESPFDFEGWAVTRIHGFAPNTRRVGDHGIDGRGTLAMKPDRYDSRLALAQVKGGRFNLGNLRDFKAVSDRDNGAVNCFISLEPVTSREAHAEAAGMRQIHIKGQPFDRMNLWSIADYFDGRMPSLPLMVDPYTGRVENQTELAL
jgi:DNA modification methylase